MFFNEISIKNIGFDPANPHAAHGAPPGAAPGQIAVAIVHGLNETDTKPDDLAALFAVYGNIQRVKIMYNKRSTALVQFDRMESVTNAMAMLTGTNLHGNEIKIEVQEKRKNIKRSKSHQNF